MMWFLIGSVCTLIACAVCHILLSKQLYARAYKAGHADGERNMIDLLGTVAWTSNLGQPVDRESLRTVLLEKMA